MHLIQQYSDDTCSENEEETEFEVTVGGDQLETLLTNHPWLKDIDLVKNKRSVKRKYVVPCADNQHIEPLRRAEGGNQSTYLKYDGFQMTSLS